MKLRKQSWISAAILTFFLIAKAEADCQENTIAFNRGDFYAAMSSREIGDVNGQINSLKEASVHGKPAFEGALLMKKAGLINGPSRKLNLFKQGHNKLEAEISRDSSNGEFRFLRLMIQEHAPGMLHYKGDLEKDSAYIRHSFKKLPEEVQRAITDYSKTSKVLRPGDF